jgi:ribosomal protein S18 acetylase RimI-like enzyme
MNIVLRKAVHDDLSFARALYFETMRGIIDQLFGWDEAREEESFARLYRMDEVSIVVVEGRDAGWMQVRESGDEIQLLSLYVAPAMQRQGIGTEVLRGLVHRSKKVSLSVVKINPALHFYERHGFRVTHEDQYKFHLLYFDV